jgi:hypothetical protein
MIYKMLILYCLFTLSLTTLAEEFDIFGEPIVTTIAPEDVPADPGFIPVTTDSLVNIPVVVIPTVFIPAVDKVLVLTPEVMKTIFDGDYKVSPVAVFTPTVVDTDNPLAQYTIMDSKVMLPVSVATPELISTFGVVNGVVQVPIQFIRAGLVPQFKIRDNKVLTNNEGVVSTLNDSKDGITKERTFLTTVHPKNFVGDKRTVQYAQNKSSTNKVWTQWKAIYAQSFPPIAYVQIADITKVKLIAEMRVAESLAARNNLMEELKYFKTLGYNTVLAVWEGKDLESLLSQIDMVKGLGYKVYFTFGTREKLTDDIFIDTNVYKRGLETLARYCDGYVIGWRRTSLHLFKADKQWINYSLNCVRIGNPNILVFGEIYRGYAGNNNPDGSYKEDEFLANIPANASGAFVVNFGYQGVRPDGVLKLVRSVTSVPLVVVVVGEKPYYMSNNKNNKTNQQNREIISRIENRFRKFDFGTATLAGDGSNEVYNKAVSDDLCKSHWSK